MAETSSDAFLTGQGVPVELPRIETELTRLWGPAAEQAGGPELENPNVTRIVLANLVVAGRLAQLGRLQETLDTVTALYPCRTILLVRTDEPGRTLSAEVSALCHLPAPGLPQVCSERIVLRAGPEASDLLPGAVRPLLEADLPFVLWWTDDPRREAALFRDLGDECSRLILDLPDPGADPAALRLGLDPTISPFARDTAWFGLTRWRELVASLFDAVEHRATLGRIDSVRIEALAPTRGATPRLAAWLVAWLAGQLGWTPTGRPEPGNGRLRARFDRPGGSGTVAVEIVTESAPGLAFTQLTGLTLTARGEDGTETFALQRASPRASEVRVEIDSAAYCTLPRAVFAPELEPARRVAAALESSRHDPPFQRALPHLLWLMEG